MTIEPADRFVRNPDLVTREIAGETLLVPITGKLANLADMFSLNETGAHVWQALEPETDARALCEALMLTFDVGEDEAWQDVTELLHGLLEAELITRREDPAVNLS